MPWHIKGVLGSWDTANKSRAIFFHFFSSFIIDKKNDPAHDPGAGPELEADAVDYLSTTPERLLKTVDVVLLAYDKNKSRESLLGETAQARRENKRGKYNLLL